MLKNKFSQTLILAILIIFCSIVITLLTNGGKSDGRALFYHYIDFLFFTNLPVFIVGSIMIIGESGLFNVFNYSTHKVRSILSGKYRYTLLESESIKEKEIPEHLREKYLYIKKKYNYTAPIFLASTIIFIVLIIYIALVYQ